MPIRREIVAAVRDRCLYFEGFNISSDKEIHSSLDGGIRVSGFVAGFFVEAVMKIKVQRTADLISEDLIEFCVVVAESSRTLSSFMSLDFRNSFGDGIELST